MSAKARTRRPHGRAKDSLELSGGWQTEQYVGFIKRYHAFSIPGTTRQDDLLDSRADAKRYLPSHLHDTADALAEDWFIARTRLKYTGSLGIPTGDRKRHTSDLGFDLGHDPCDENWNINDFEVFPGLSPDDLESYSDSEDDVGARQSGQVG